MDLAGVDAGLAGSMWEQEVGESGVRQQLVTAHLEEVPIQNQRYKVAISSFRASECSMWFCVFVCVCF